MRHIKETGQASEYNLFSTSICIFPCESDRGHQDLFKFTTTLINLYQHRCFGFYASVNGVKAMPALRKWVGMLSYMNRHQVAHIVALYALARLSSGDEIFSNMNHIYCQYMTKYVGDLLYVNARLCKLLK